MIVVDTSALIAILLREPEAEQFNRALFDARTLCMGAPTAFEFLLVAEGRKGRDVREDAKLLLEAQEIDIIPWTVDHFRAAEDAMVRFGKGRHAAKLNFGDCMSYAVAKLLDAPLLYKGDDFPQTDIRSAIG